MAIFALFIKNNDILYIMNELKWFFVMLVLFWFLWAATGGPSRIENKSRALLEEPQPINSGKPYSLQELREGTRP